METTVAENDEWTEEIFKAEASKLANAEGASYPDKEKEVFASCAGGEAAGPEDEKVKFSSEFILKCLSENEVGDAALFTELQKGKLIYDHSAGVWLRWTGHYWGEDRIESQISAVPKELCAVYELELQRISWRANSALARGEPPDKKAEAIEKLLRGRLAVLRCKTRIMNVLALARAGPDGLSTDGEHWDRKQLLVAFLNGVLNLETGHFGQGKPEQMILAHCEAKWKGEDEPCPNFERFILEIQNGDSQVVGFLQRLLGYCLTGLSVERILIILYGSRGQNGKGTLLELMKKIMGMLAAEIPSETLLSTGKETSGAAPRPDIMLLKGKRLVWCSETNKGRPLDVAKCKWISGGDTMVARNLHANFITFEQTAKIFLMTNNRPKADGQDDALWQRLLLVPFVLSFVADPRQEHERKRDEFIQDKLLKESSGIMAWLYKGYLEWRMHGLRPPEQVLMATQNFREENDTISQFIADCCIVAPGIRVNPTELYNAFAKFCSDEGIEPEKQSSFFSYIKTRFNKDKNARGRWYEGLCLKVESGAYQP
jgi:putative DNA primase/helicase